MATRILDFSDGFTSSVPPATTEIPISSLKQEVPTGTVDGVNAAFVISDTPISSDNVIVTLDGIIIPETEWALAGTTITFTTPPALGQSVYIIFAVEEASGGGGGGGATEPTVEYRTLTGGEATAESLTLVGTPATPSKVLLDQIGGTSQEYGVDYSVSGTTLTWSGLGLDGVLIAGDKLRIVYWE